MTTRTEVVGVARHPDEAAGGTGRADGSPGQLAAEVAKDLSTLVRQEIALAKAELQQEAKTAGVAAGALGGAGFAVYFVLVFLSLGLMWGLDAWMPLGWAAVVVAGVWAVVAAVLAAVGRSRLKRFNPKPERTIETVKEDVQWAKTRNA
jgi:hypothetical protein